ncbi:MAG: DEAD/DEAH box helicase [Pirellulaceae bacterium]|nr:DEAD/DEAH box helicase [Pirellulaceae bacterium]
MMQYHLAVTPEGIVGLVSVAHKSGLGIESAALPSSLVAAFNESLSTGLTQLASQDWSEACAQWSAEFAFWRAYARRYFSALCRQYSTRSHHWNAPACPDPTTLDEIVHAAPPMLGLEYLRSDVLRQVWESLDSFTQKQLAASQLDLTAYLKSLDEQWNLIGRVTFHLAENKKDPAAPFAFLATFTEGQSSAGVPQHVPLSEALKQSLSSKDSSKINQLLEPVSRAAKSCPVVAELLESRKLFALQAWGIRHAYAFLSAVPDMEQAGIVVRVPNWWNAARPPRPQVNVRIGSRAPGLLGLESSLDFDIDVAIEGQPLSEAELKQLLAAREGLVLLRGNWVQVDAKSLESALTHWRTLQKQHVQGIDFLQSMRLLAGASLDANMEDQPAQEWSRVEAGPWLREVLEQLRSPSDRSAIDPESGIQAKLRPYQADGVRWLWLATQLGLGVCLADDMGLGKTLQVISLLVQLKQQSSTAVRTGRMDRVRETTETPTPSLLIVPTSLLGNWQRELARFAPQLRIQVAHRSYQDAEQLQKMADDPAQVLSHCDAVITTYGTIRKADWIRQLTWRLIVLDEAQAIKNSAAAQTKAIKQIPARGRIVMTGTPVENDLGDLWSLFDFSSPGLLGSATVFKRFVSSKDEAIRAKHLVAVRKLIQPYVLRRLKSDPTVAPDLPPKTEMRVDCGLAPMQAALYAEVIQDLKTTLDLATGIQRRGLVLAVLMQLKQICNHPALYLKQANFKAQDSGKFAEMASLCELMSEKQEKVIVFSQFQSMCEPLKNFLAEVFGREGFVLTGKTTAKARSKMVADFQQPFGPPYMVISVKAGGTGLNLTQASHVIHFDRWWNPAVEDQATDRAFRIGQTRHVLVHKFVCRGTLEERIDELIQSKRKLSQELFDQSGEINLTDMTTEQIMQFVALDISKAAGA